MNDTLDALRAIWEQRRENVLERVGVVEAAVAAALGGTLDAELRERAAREAHMLAGSAGTFGFAAASENARELERAFGHDGGVEHSELVRLAELAGALRTELEGAPGAAAEEPADTAQAPAAPRPSVLVAGDPELTADIAAEANARGVTTRALFGLDAVAPAIRDGADLLVLDLAAPEGVGEALDVLAAAALELPVVVLTDPELLVDRVEVARRGGRTFLPRRASPLDLVDAVLSLRARLRPRDATILAVDDDPAMLDALSVVLGAAGLRVERCENPGVFWESLERVRPDLVVLDVDMPHVSGLELCRALRGDARWESLPVMILTARTDQATVVDVFAAGADDFVSKPFIGPELLARIHGRLERVRLFRALAETDPLTGLANRRRSYEALTESLAGSDRLGEPLSLSVIDLDGFKQLNDVHGHAAGDSALRAVAGALNRTFSGMENVARWGGDEFVVSMPGLTAADARERLAAFLEDLRAAGVGKGEELVRASAGVAEYPRDATDLDELHRAADRALYAAKSAGGDRVHDAGADLQGDPERVDVVLVEDDEMLCELVEHALHTRGYTTRRFMDGLEASVELAAATPEVVAPIVLLDWDLPSVDGLRILTTMAENGTLRRSQVIMLTGRATEAEVLQALEAGAMDHIAKPFSIPVLMQRIRHALTRPQ
ncbi:MAG: response regulator [Solirubrobacteraceae bacterium]